MRIMFCFRHKWKLTRFWQDEFDDHVYERVCSRCFLIKRYVQVDDTYGRWNAVMDLIKKERIDGDSKDEI